MADGVCTFVFSADIFEAGKKFRCQTSIIGEADDWRTVDPVHHGKPCANTW